MRVAGTATLDAAPAQVLAVLRDPRRFVAALPNADELEFEPGEDGSFRAKIRPAIALGEVPLETVWRPLAAGDGAAAAAARGERSLAYAMEGGSGEHWVELEATVALRERAGADASAGIGEAGGEAAGDAGTGAAGPTASEAEWTVEFEVTGTMRSAGQRTIAAIVAAQAEAVLHAAVVVLRSG